MMSSPPIEVSAGAEKVAPENDCTKSDPPSVCSELRSIASRPLAAIVKSPLMAVTPSSFWVSSELVTNTLPSIVVGDAGLQMYTVD